jgi:sugar lactone lactonase YvrE
LNRPRGVTVDSSGAVFVADSGNARVRRIDPQGGISTIFGQGYFRFNGEPIGAVGAVGAAAVQGQRRRPIGMIPNEETLSEPWALAVDTAGHVFIAEAGAGQVRQLNVGGSQSIVAKDLGRPSGVAWDPEAGLYIADTENQVIRRVDAGGSISVAAGTGARGFSGDGEAAAKALLNVPKGLAVDGAGNLYVADDLNQRIRRISPDGKIATVAGRGTPGFAGDGGPALKAALFRPSAVAVDAFGNLYIADTMNNRIRKVSMSASFSAVPAAVDLTGALSRTVRLRASNPALTWQAKASEPWIQLSAAQGAFPANVTISADSPLAAGDHTASIEFTSPNATPPSFTVSVVIRKNP